MPLMEDIGMGLDTTSLILGLPGMVRGAITVARVAAGGARLAAEVVRHGASAGLRNFALRMPIPGMGAGGLGVVNVRPRGVFTVGPYRPSLTPREPSRYP